jgi:hypothetical protein
MSSCKGLLISDISLFNILVIFKKIMFIPLSMHLRVDMILKDPIDTLQFNRI